MQANGFLNLLRSNRSWINNHSKIVPNNSAKAHALIPLFFKRILWTLPSHSVDDGLSYFCWYNVYSHERKIPKSKRNTIQILILIKKSSPSRTLPEAPLSRGSFFILLRLLPVQWTRKARQSLYVDNKATLILTSWPFCAESDNHTLLIQKAEVMLVSVNYFFAIIFGG